MDELIIAGAGDGDILKLIYAINAYKNRWKIIGFTDINKNLWEKEIFGYPVLGDDSVIKDYKDAWVVVNVSRTPQGRKKAVENVLKYTDNIATLVHPNVDTCCVEIGKGVIIFDGVTLGYGVKIDDFALVRFNVSVGHDVYIGEYSIINPTAAINGRVIVKRESLIGAGAKIVQEITIGENCVISMGASVFKDVPSNSTYLQNYKGIILSNFRFNKE